MDHGKTCLPPNFEQSPVRLDRAPQLADIVAQHFSETSRFEEIALHVDDEESALGRPKFVGIRLSVDGRTGSVGHDLGCSAVEISSTFRTSWTQGNCHAKGASLASDLLPV
jgi:hypothetical protein